MEVYPKNRLLRCNGNLEKKKGKRKIKVIAPDSPFLSGVHQRSFVSFGIFLSLSFPFFRSFWAFGPHFPSFLRPIPFSFFLKHPYSFQFNFLIKIKICRVNYYYVFNCPMLSLGYIYIS